MFIVHTSDVHKGYSNPARSIPIQLKTTIQLFIIALTISVKAKQLATIKARQKFCTKLNNYLMAAIKAKQLS